MKTCMKCHREMEDNEVTRTFHISKFYVCINTTDCERAAKCSLCQDKLTQKGAS